MASRRADVIQRRPPFLRQRRRMCTYARSSCMHACMHACIGETPTCTTKGRCRPCYNGDQHDAPAHVTGGRWCSSNGDLPSVTCLPSHSQVCDHVASVLNGGAEFGGESQVCLVQGSNSCGDGVVNSVAGEACDDGGTAAGDGCDASCQVECGYYCVEDIALFSTCTACAS